MKPVKLVVVTGIVLTTTVFALTNVSPTNAIAANAKADESKRSFTAVWKAASTVDIKDKMLNAIDNYKDVQGSVSYRTCLYQENIAFVVSEGNNPSAYIKETSPTDNAVVYESYSEGSHVTEYDHKRNEKDSLQMANNDLPTEKRGAIERAYKNNMQENVYVHRTDPANASFKADVLFPQDYAFWMDDFTKNYTVTGHESILGRDATVIEGTLPKGLDVKRKAVNFKFWVDTQTGILLKDAETDSSGNLVNLIEVNDIKIDQGVHLDKTMLQIPDSVTDLDKLNAPAVSK